jgi:hypothetical protein
MHVGTLGLVIVDVILIFVAGAVVGTWIEFNRQHKRRTRMLRLVELRRLHSKTYEHQMGYLEAIGDLILTDGYFRAKEVGARLEQAAGTVVKP